MKKRIVTPSLNLAKYHLKGNILNYLDIGNTDLLIKVDHCLSTILSECGTVEEIKERLPDKLFSFMPDWAYRELRNEKSFESSLKTNPEEYNDTLLLINEMLLERMLLGE